MNEHKFPERLREDARPLRYEPDDVVLTRLQARIRERVAVPHGVAQLLAAWFRPIATSVAALALAAAVGTTWFARNLDTANTIDAMAANNSQIEVAVGGDTFSVTN